MKTIEEERALAAETPVSVTVLVDANPSQGGTLFRLSFPSTYGEVCLPGVATVGIDPVVGAIVRAIGPV